MTYAAHGISVRIGSATLLDSVSLEVRAGEIVALAGPNGAGKSTLIQVLAGDRAPSAGSATLEGRAVAEWPRAELARRRAVMSTDRAVAFAFTAEEVALLGRLPLHGGDPDDTDRAIVRALLEAVDCRAPGRARVRHALDRRAPARAARPRRRPGRRDRGRRPSGTLPAAG